MTAAIDRDFEYRKKTARFIVVSLVLHAIFMFAMSQEGASPKALPTNALDIDVVPLSPQDIARLKKQIAESSLTKKADKAVDDAFLGQQTQVVDRQTRARVTAPFQDGRGGANGRSEAARQPKLALGSLGVQRNYQPMGNLGPGVPSSTSDYLKDLAPGAETMLNTKEYKYFSYYQRIRKQLEQYWEPGLKQRLKAMFERGRSLAEDHEHATRVLVVLDKEGTITKVLVENTSGLLDLDQSAVDAFNRAGPFPNPPQGMVDNDGTVKVEWEFVLKT